MRKRHFIAGLLLPLLFSVSSQAASFEQLCHTLPATPLVTVSTLPVVVESGIAVDDMRSMTIRTTGAESMGELATVGTTLADKVWELSYGLSMRADPVSGRVCYRPAVNVVIGYDPMRISVASPYRSGTCAHDLIVAHERGHVKIYEDFLPVAAHAIEDTLRDRLTDRIRFADSAEAATAEITGTVRSLVSKVVKTEMARSDLLHSRFDSIEESLHLLNACAGDVRRALDEEVTTWKSAASGVSE